MTWLDHFRGRCSPEVEYHLLSARSRFTPQITARLRQLADNGLDWESLIAASWEHRTVPLLHLATRTGCGDLVSPEVADGLRLGATTVMARSLMLTAEMVRLVEVCRAQSLRLLPFKGPVLARKAFGDAGLGLRQFDDLDLLVEPHNRSGAAHALISAGYDIVEDSDRAKPLKAVNPRLGVTVELHQRLLPLRSAFKMDRDVWRRATTFELFGREVLTLCDEDLLLYLCAHGTKHFWCRLQWICDIAELAAARTKLDWNALCSLAQQNGGRRVLWIGLTLARRLLGAAIPPEATRGLSDYCSEQLADEIVGAVLLEGARGIAESQNYHFQISARERLRDRLRVTVEILRSKVAPTHRDRERPGMLRRPLRIAREHRIRELTTLLSRAISR